jgi:hypothetical protein
MDIQPTNAGVSVQAGLWQGPNLVRFLILGAGLILSITLVGRVWNAPQNEFYAGRLAPTFAILSPKYHLYVGSTPGPVLSTIYPPIGYLAYLPATISGTPAAAMMIAAVVSVLMTLVPFAFLACELVVQKSWGRWSAGAAVVLFGLLDLEYTDVVGGIHANIPGVGLAMSGAWALVHARRHPSRGVFLSAVFMSASVWAYQQMVPALAAGFFLTLATLGTRRALLYAVSAFLTGMALFGVFWITFGGADMFFNIWTLPKSHPWMGNPTTPQEPSSWIYSGQLGTRLKSIGYLFQKMWINAAVLWTFAASLIAETCLTAKSGVRCGVAAPIWVLSCIGVALLPTATLAAVKVGGSSDSYGIALYFIAAAVAVGLARFLEGPGRPGNREAFCKLVPIAMMAVFGIAAVPSWGLYFKPGREPSASAAQRAYEYLRAHPGQVFFPWHPLSHLLSSGELTHFDPAIYDRDLARMTLPASAFLAGCPEKFSSVAYKSTHLHSIEDHFIVSGEASPSELADWTFFKVEGIAPWPRPAAP